MGEEMGYEGGGSRGQGAVDGNPIAMALFLFMVFVLLQWMTQPGGPLVNCAQCQANVGAFFSPSNRSTSWMLYLVVPITMAMMVTWLTDKIAEQDEGSVGQLARQFRDLAPQQQHLYQGLLGVRKSALRETRRQASAAVAQGRARNARRAELASQRLELEREMSRIEELLKNPALDPTEVRELNLQYFNIKEQLSERRRAFEGFE